MGPTHISEIRIWFNKSINDGNYFLSNSKFEKADAEFKKALVLAEKLDDLALIECWVSFSELCKLQKNIDLAIKWIRQAKNHFSEHFKNENYWNTVFSIELATLLERAGKNENEIKTLRNHARRQFSKVGIEKHSVPTPKQLLNCTRVEERFFKNFYRSTTHCFSAKDGRSGGTGTLIHFKNQYFFITAGHVIQKMPKNCSVQIFSGKSGRPEMPRIIDSAYYKGYEGDFGAFRLFKPSDFSKEFLEFNDLEFASEKEVSGSALLFFGIPGINKKVKLNLEIGRGKVKARVMPFLGYCRSYDGSNEINLDYSSNLTLNKNGEKVTLPSPKGMSGSLVFTHEMKLAGMIVQHNETLETLVANSAKNLKIFLDNYDRFLMGENDRWYAGASLKRSDS